MKMPIIKLSFHNFKQVLLPIILFLCVIQPFSYVVSNTHDSASQAAFEYWTMNHYQYGNDIIQNVGPLGFINYPQVYTGLLVKEKLITHLCLTALLVVLALFIAGKIHNKAKLKIFLLAFIIFSPALSPETHIANADVQLYLITLLTTYTIFFYKRPTIILPLVITLGMLALAKGTLFFISLAITCVSAIHYLANKEWKLSIAIPVIYLTSIFIFWSICGQEFLHLPDFLKATLNFSKGYQDAMAIYENPYFTVLGIVIFLAAITAIIIKNLIRIITMPVATRISALVLSLVEMFILFAAWKHGFVRADKHIYIFLQFVIVAITLFIWLPSFPNTKNYDKIIKLQNELYKLTLILCILSLIFISPEPYPRFLANLKILLDIPEYTFRLENDLKQTIDDVSVPEIKAIVKDQPISHFGYLPAPMLYNGFNYKPMPATISFAGWNSWVIGKDAQFFKDDKSAPQYILYKAQTIDNRIVSLDNAPAQLEIFHHYDPVISEKDNLLLERNNAGSALTFVPVGQEVLYNFEQVIAVPVVDDPLILKIKLQNNLFSKFITILYKPARYTITYRLANGITTEKLLIPPMAEEGFMIAPLIDSNQDLLDAYSKKTYKEYLKNNKSNLSRIIDFKVSCMSPFNTCAHKTSASFETVHGINFGRID